MKLYRGAYLNNGGAFLSRVDLDQPIKELSESTLAYIIATAYDLEISFNFYEDSEINEDERDEIESNNFTYIDLSEFDLPNLYVDLWSFRLISMDEMIPDDAIHIVYRRVNGKKYTITRSEDVFSDIEISNLETDLQKRVAFLVEYTEQDGSRVLFNKDGSIKKLKGVTIYEN